MFDKILWATDGSESADRALQYAKVLAQKFDAELIMVHSAEYVITSPGGEPAYAEEEEHQVKLRSQATAAQEEGLKVSVVIAGGRQEGAGHVIADAAREADADLIVVGTRGLSSLAGLLLGSVTQRLLHLAPCPVVAVPPARA
jgi:nucleotide-binding universal stress UspA family protein